MKNVSPPPLSQPNYIHCSVLHFLLQVNQVTKSLIYGLYEQINLIVV